MTIFLPNTDKEPCIFLLFNEEGDGEETGSGGFFGGGFFGGFEGRAGGQQGLRGAEQQKANVRAEKRRTLRR